MRSQTTSSAEKHEADSSAPRRHRVAEPEGPGQTGMVPTLIAMQRTHGNRFVQRLVSDMARGNVEAPADVQESIQRTRGGGQELQAGARGAMERAFGADFGDVRLHTDATADTLARSLSAVAFTTGRDVYFRQGTYDPDGAAGRKLLAHELTHVVQQGGSTPHGPLTVGAPDDVYEQEADRVAEHVANSPASSESAPARSTMCTDCEEEQERRTINRSTVRTPDMEEEGGRQTVASIQRDFAIAPPNAAWVAVTLTAPQMADALKYNRLKLATAAPDLLRTLRDVLGIAPNPPNIDEELVRAIVRWQAANNQTQDGKLNPDTAAPLFAELRAEGLATESKTLAGLIRRGRVLTGPTYTPDAGLAPSPDAGQMHVGFGMAATFANDPDNGVFASCCEVRQEIQWDAAMATGFGAGGANPVPHAGFPAAHPAGTFIEDRDGTNTTRYGHRGGLGGGVGGNRYLNSAAALDQTNGTTFEGHDDPHMLTTDHGQMQFRVSVVDVCNEGKRIGGTDTITINW